MDYENEGTFEMFQEAIQEAFNHDVNINDLSEVAQEIGLKPVDLTLFDQVSVDTIIKGIEVEFEHTDDASIALIITLHHLEETLEYYDLLVESGL